MRVIRVHLCEVAVGLCDRQADGGSGCRDRGSGVCPRRRREPLVAQSSHVAFDDGDAPPHGGEVGPQGLRIALHRPKVAAYRFLVASDRVYEAAIAIAAGRVLLLGGKVRIGPLDVAREARQITAQVAAGREAGILLERGQVNPRGLFRRTTPLPFLVLPPALPPNPVPLP